MRIDLSGKTALVSGSTEGLGFGIALGLAKAGAHVVLSGRKQEKVDAAVASLRAEVSGASVLGVAADLGTAAGCEGMVAAVPATDILVNNLGFFSGEDFFEGTDELWQRYHDINVMSGVRLSQAYAPGMVDRGWGRIIFISSESGFNIPADMLAYGVSKTANLAVSRGLAKRLAGTGVTVNAVLPGPTLTDGLQAMIRADQEASGQSMEDYANDFAVKKRPTTLIRRVAQVEEVVNMVVYAASPQASATTGAALRVDGGIVDSII